MKKTALLMGLTLSTLALFGQNKTVESYKQIRK